MLYVDKHILKSERTNISMHRDGGGEMWFGVGQGYHIMSLLNPEEGHPVKYFLEPVVVFLNYAEIDYNYRHVAMVGISGGWGVGWTTTLAAAIDYRIESSFPIAGSYPFFLRNNTDLGHWNAPTYEDWGDWEETIPELYRIANYLELYIIGSYGIGRSQLQIINKYDSACFAGVKSQTYVPIIKEKIAKLGQGKWNLLLDDTHYTHTISSHAMKTILKELDLKFNPNHN